MYPLPPRRLRGASMIEALVSFLILSLGLLAFVRMQAELRFAADVSRQRSEAIRLAEEHMEQLRSFATLAAYNSSLPSSSTGPVSTTHSVTLHHINTAFTITRTTRSSTEPDYRALAVRAGWTDRRGEVREVLLTSAIAGLDPAQQGRLSIPPSGSPVKTPYERNVRIPIQAVNLNKVESGFIPPGQNNSFWVFESASADIIKRCEFSSGYTTLTENDTNGAYANATCTSRKGYLVKGFIRFDASSSVNPDPQDPQGNACRFYNRIVKSRVNDSNCSDVSDSTFIADALGVTMTSGTGYSPASVLPPFECYHDFKTAVLSSPPWNYANYYCAVYVKEPSTTEPNPSWSGRSILTLGADAKFKVGTSTKDVLNCRYSADYNRNGQFDASEHPYDYTNVSETLTGQNFLIISGNKSCPSTSAYIGNTKAEEDKIHYQTCLHQAEGSPIPACPLQPPA